MKIKITIDSGTNGELRDYVVDKIVLERILSASGSSLQHCKALEGNLPPNDARTLEFIRKLQFDWKF